MECQALLSIQVQKSKVKTRYQLHFVYLLHVSSPSAPRFFLFFFLIALLGVIKKMHFSWLKKVNLGTTSCLLKL